MTDAAAIRHEFPALEAREGHTPAVYLDSAATSLKPRAVIDAVAGVYLRGLGGTHRGVHRWSAAATDALEATRAELAAWLGGGSPSEVGFTRGATESLNLVATGWGASRLGPGDEVLVSGLEHHSSVLPWRRVCRATGARLVVAPLDASGTVPLEAFSRRMGHRTRVVVMTHLSNVTGAVLPVRAVASLARSLGALVVVDGAQAVAHLDVDVAALGCDFYAFSAHKMYGPDGVGVLWGRHDHLEALEPLVVGGGAVSAVHDEEVTTLPVPHRLEAGTPPLAGVVGLGAALTFLRTRGRSARRDFAAPLRAKLVATLEATPRVRILGETQGRVGLVSFVLEGVHAHDAGSFLDRAGVAVRAGHHCAQPVMDHFGVTASLRASLGVYNTAEDLDIFTDALRQALQELG